MNQQDLEVLARVLQHGADTSQYYQIKINGHCASFRGVRAFASIGAAKAAINRDLQALIEQLAYRAQYAKDQQQKDDFAVLQATETIRQALLNEASVRKAGKDLTNQLLDTGFITIELIQ